MTGKQVTRWMQAAAKDGWTCEPLFPVSESADTAAVLKKDGFIAHVMRRPSEQARIDLWGPDSLACFVPSVYSMAAVREMLRTCTECGQRNVVVYRCGFAARVCKPCLPEARKKYEFPGWYR